MTFNNGTIKYLNYSLVNVKEIRNLIVWRKIIIQNNQLYLEGIDNLWIPKENYFYFCILGNKTFYPKSLNYSSNDFNSLFGLIDKGRRIIFNISLENIQEQTIYLYISYKNKNCEIFPIQGYITKLPSLNHGYFISDNYIIKMLEKRLIIYRYNKSIENFFEKQYCNQLEKLGKYYIIKLRKRNKKYRKKLKKKWGGKEIWIINDRRQKAGDNGEYFFRYLKTKNLSGLKIFFAIQSNCSDYQRLKKLGNILDLNSKEYINIFLKSDKIISSVSNLWVDNPFGGDQKYIKDLFEFDFIFIQNGIIKDDLSDNLNKLSRKIDLFVTSTKKEYNSLLSFNYGFNKKDLILTGLSRFDALEKYNKNNNKANDYNKMILVIPTWRAYIKGNKESLIYESIHSESFKYTKFFSFYNNLINDQKLIKMMKSYNYKGVFCLHQHFSAQWIDFTKNQQFRIEESCNYQRLLLEGSLLVTDYSSIFFDFGYLKKPIIYTHFDYKEYRLNQYKEGYYNYKRDGFGPIYYDINNTFN